jgi:hypothetical protein
MKKLMIVMMLVLSGCAGPKLMKCVDKAAPHIMVCEDHVEGSYYKCKASNNLRSCVKPD